MLAAPHRNERFAVASGEMGAAVAAEKGYTKVFVADLSFIPASKSVKMELCIGWG